jgi:hypothetical protein
MVVLTGFSRAGGIWFTVPFRETITIGAGGRGVDALRRL